MTMTESSNQPVCLITGIGGFTGRHLKSLLESQGMEVWGTSHRPSSEPRTIACDFTDPHQVQSMVQHVQPDYVFHLAAKSFVAGEDLKAFYEVNTLGTEVLLKALASQSKTPKKVVLASSATVYGPQKTHILDETLCPNPNNHYAYSKFAMEQIAKTWFDRLPILIVRPFNYTGVGQAEHFVIPKIVSHYRKKAEFIELGNTNVAREFNSVQDICRWLLELSLSEKAIHQIVNLCTGQTHSLNQVMETLNRLSAHSLEVRVNPAFVRTNDIPVLQGSPDKLHSYLRDTQTQSLESLLAQMLKD